MPIKTLTGPLLVGAGGGIALYKVCSLVSEWAKANQPVRVVLTERAQDFVTPLTFATLARHPAYIDEDFWRADQGRPLHIALGEWTGVMVLAPLTAQTLGQLAHGLADNLLLNIVLASRCPILLAPAMNTAMWEQQSVQRNLKLVLGDPRYHLIPPQVGRLACDSVGPGRLAEPTEILAYTQSLFWTGGQRDLAGQRVLISGGSTREPLDPVRFIGNPATGQMALALARAAYHRGAQVTLIHGPMAEPVPDFITQQAITTSEELGLALLAQAPHADLILMNAAVGDVRPRQTSPHKLAKAEIPLELPLAPVPDILSQLTAQKPTGQRIVGFAAQTGDILPPAWAKLRAKKVDALFVNPIDQVGSGFASPTNQGFLLLANGAEISIPQGPKLAVAHQIFDQLLPL